MKLPYALYQELVDKYLPHFSLGDRNRITRDCFVNGYSEEEATEYINSFKEQEER
jgi:hypothetical protein